MEMESTFHRNALSAPLAVAANDGALPTDVLRDVLLRLPADELCRLRLVCRSWRSLTSDPILAKAHSSRHVLVVGLRPGCHGMEVQFLDPFSGRTVKRIRLGQTWNGHDLSAHHCQVYISERYLADKTYVLNPTTGSFTMLPNPGMVTENENIRGVIYESVFGRVPFTGEYKALRIHRERWYPNKTELSYYVATLGGSKDITWRLKPWPPVRVSLEYRENTVVNGVVYFWLHLDPAISDEMAAFDLAAEEWSDTLLRGPLSSHNIRVKEQERVHFSLANLNGCLVSICDFYEDCSMDIWFLMDPDKELWTKQYSLRTDGTIFIPLWILDDGRVLIWVNRVEELRAYDPRTSTWTNLSTVERFFDVGMYHGSLLCSDIAY
ncbi:hypothetical protein HU200_015936 [Digitaria exilis]|uniref:F-box domain-containing protein n=1 Tax=Digitaria exilis TaxID=1010633 RepID=A0A835F9A0_9POAL|nr:hypothetical protein HU200_015936 [Digitaria exilis]